MLVDKFLSGTAFDEEPELEEDPLNEDVLYYYYYYCIYYYYYYYYEWF